MAEDGGNIGRPPANRPAVIAALRGHGISGTVAADLWRLAQDLLRRTRRRGLEHAVTLDAESGEQPGPMLTGTASSTDLSPHLRSMRAGREYVVLHTHPRSTSFSQFDILVLTEHVELRTLVAVGVDGTWYILSCPPGPQTADARAIFDDVIRERLRLLRIETPELEISHRATAFVAARHGLMYDQVMGMSDEQATT